VPKTKTYVSATSRNSGYDRLGDSLKVAGVVAALKDAYDALLVDSATFDEIIYKLRTAFQDLKKDDPDMDLVYVLVEDALYEAQQGFDDARAAVAAAKAAAEATGESLTGEALFVTPNPRRIVKP
jgi:hypothetical protein